VQVVTRFHTAIITHNIQTFVFIFLRVKVESFTFGAYLPNLVDGNVGAAKTLWGFTPSVDKQLTV
jgi:hypothetical protein